MVPERPVLVAPAPFAGTLRATEAAAAIGRGLERAGLMPPDLCPVADGGPGTLEVLLPRLGGELRDGVALVEDGGTAIVEGGEPIAAAAQSGAAVIVVAAGAGPAGALEPIAGAGGVRLVVLCDTRAALDEAPAGWPRDPRGVPGTAAGCGLAGEIGTRTRQAGVPLHAIVGEDRLDAFGKRIIDLMRVIEATDVRALEAAGEALGHELAEGLA